MRRNLVSLLAIVTLLTIVNPAQLAVVAAPVPSTISIQGAALTADQRAAILQGLQSTVDSYRGQPAWRCVLAPAEAGAGGAGGVHINAQVSTASVSVDVQIGSKTAGSRQGTVAGAGSAAFREAAANALSDVLSGVAPCTPTIKIRGRTSLSGDVNFEASFDGETQLALAEDGSFSGTMQANYAQSPITFPGIGSCTFGGGNQQTIDYAGTFDDSDGTLTFTRMDSRASGGNVTLNCILQGQPFSTSVPAPDAFGADPAALTAVRLPLEDGARASIPFSAAEAGLSSEFAVELALGQGAVSGQPRPSGTPAPVTPTPGAPSAQRPAPVQLSQSLQPVTPNTVPI